MNEDRDKGGNILVKCASARLIHFSSESSRARQLRASRDDLRANEKERERIGLYENNKISPIIIQPRASLFDLSDPFAPSKSIFRPEISHGARFRFPSFNKIVLSFETRYVS